MNTYVIHDARLVADPETSTSKNGSTITKMRLADNPPGKQDGLTAKFVTAKAFGKTAENAAKLSAKDVITVSGHLQTECWKDKKTGEEAKADVLIVQNFRVQKSESFYGDSKKQEEAAVENPFGE